MKAWRLAKATWEVLLLADDRGRCQVLDVVEELLDIGGRGMLSLLKVRVADHGPPTENSNLCSAVEGEIFEFRRGSVRVFWFYDHGKVVVAANAYKKQGQKAPRRHVKTAEQCRKRYVAAKQEGTLEIEDLVTGEDA